MNRKIVCLLFLFFIILSDKASAQSTVFIPVDSANRMIQSYLNSIGNDAGDLKSLIFDADSLRALLSDQPQIKKVRLFFAHTLSYINSGGEGQPCGYRSGELTIVIAGYNTSGNYLFYPAGKVPDTGIPCPSSCPSSGEASSNLLPN